MIFYVNFPDHDDDEWRQVDNWSAEGAAQEYAERCDESSAGELFQDNLRDSIVVNVKTGHMDAPAVAFKVTFDYAKTFDANRIEEPAAQSRL